MRNLYEVTWTVKYTREIWADDRDKAIEISEDMGDGAVEDPSPEFQVSSMRAKLVKKGTVN